jgi:hypothetical protein
VVSERRRGSVCSLTYESENPAGKCLGWREWVKFQGEGKGQRNWNVILAVMDVDVEEVVATSKGKLDIAVWEQVSNQLQRTFFQLYSLPARLQSTKIIKMGQCNLLHLLRPS